jgi:hypothetical protein
MNPKTLLVDIGGKFETISVDRLKPDHMDLEHPAQVAKPKRCGRPPRIPQPSSSSKIAQKADNPNAIHPRCTRSGRQVIRPQRYISVLGGVV